MPIEAKEIPKLLLLRFMIVLTSYATVWAAGKIRDEVSTMVNS